MSDNTSTQYAIRLPDGQLARDLPAAIMQGHPEYKTLPGGQNAWLWGEQRRHEAYQTLHAIADHLKPWGLTDLLKAHASVVMVRTTVEILDGDHDPEPPSLPDYHRLPDGAEKELRSLISILEEGEERSPGGARVPVIIEKLRGIVDGDKEATEEPEPRTWRNVQEIPMDTEFRLAGGSHVYRRTPEGAIHLTGGTLLPLTYFTNGPSGYVEETR